MPLTEEQKNERFAAAKAHSLAERAKMEAERAKLELETRLVEVQVRDAETRLRQQESYLARAILNDRVESQKLQDVLSGDKYHGVYIYDDQIDSASVAMCMDRLTAWARAGRTECEVRFTSPGGSIIDGLALFDYIRRLSREGMFIETSAYGYAASMAGILLQAGDRRVMARESWLLIHAPSFIAHGSLSDVRDRVDWINRMNQRVVQIFFERSQATEAPNKLSLDEIIRRYDRKDWWLSSDEALDHGFVDGVV